MEAIRAENISIRFMVGDFKNIGFKDYVIKKITGEYHVNEFWADRNVSFSLQTGDMLGIIGTNGAGKSTLLKAVTGILVPTEGKIKVRGRIAALLELGSGFDQNMTVRENTYLRGAMMGYTKDFIEEKYPEIISFAELEEFQDHPFRQLSSGMKSRLGFSIACLVDPDIIILDEVLSVGDGAFRKKSSEKMRQILQSGVTGILVSHSIGQVREICNKILWLDHGRQIVFSEEVGMICDAYEEFLRSKKLPRDEEEMKEFAQRARRKAQIRKLDAKKKEAQNVRKAIREEESDKYIGTAIGLIERNHPELLRTAKVEKFKKQRAKKKARVRAESRARKKAIEKDVETDKNTEHAEMQFNEEESLNHEEILQSGAGAPGNNR